MKSKAASGRKQSTQEKRGKESQRTLRTFFSSRETVQDEPSEPPGPSSQGNAPEQNRMVIDLVDLDDEVHSTPRPRLRLTSSGPPNVAKKKLFSLFEKPGSVPPSSLPSSLPLPTSSPRPSSKHMPSIHSSSPPPTEFTSAFSSEPDFIDIESDDPTLDAISIKGSQNDPIDLSDSPLVQTKPTKATQAIHPFFNRKVVQSKLTSGVEVTDSHLSRPLQSTPFPSCETQHLLGPVTMFPPPTSPVLRPRKRRRLSEPPNTFIGDYHRLIVEPSGRIRKESRPIAKQQIIDEEDLERYLADIPAKHLHHPAIQRFEEYYMEPNKRIERSEPWSEIWKPRRAEEVLGNEEHARYLKSWLQSLQLNLLKNSTPGQTSSKRIIRSVDDFRPRKRRKGQDEDSLDGWITDDSGEELTFGLDEDVFHLPESSPVRRKARAEELSCKENEALAEIKATGQLTNTILLSGPPGCGKTSAVYACAEQLGWQVFEVYPGIGKRTGANLSSLVGDVARNHTLTKFPRGLTIFDKLHEVTEPTSSQTEGDADSVAQSIILLEEVDILYGEDVNFWPAVIKLINRSHRPVVLTCNDPTVVPLEDLPIQTHLVFEPCSEPLAQSYLRCLALAEGHALDRLVVERHISERQSGLRIDYPDQPIHPLPTDPHPFYLDLRKAINRMQLWCAKADHCDNRSESTAHVGDWARSDVSMASDTNVCVERLDHLVDMHDMYQLERFAESISAVDSRLLGRRDAETEMEAMHQEDTEEHPDSETNYLIVGIAQEVSPIRPVLAFYSKENEAFSTCQERARARFEHIASGGRLRKGLETEGVRYEEIYEGRGLFEKRGEYQRMVVGVLDEILPVGGHGVLLPRAVLFTEYLAWLRIMATVGEGDEGSGLSGGVVGRRRGRHGLTLGRSEVDMLVRTELRMGSDMDWDWDS